MNVFNIKTKPLTKMILVTLLRPGGVVLSVVSNTPVSRGVYLAASSTMLSS